MDLGEIELDADAEAHARGLTAIADQRLANQRLSHPDRASVADIVSRLVAVQSQIYAAARWSIGQRTSGLGTADVDAALSRGEVIRTHILRDTWHLVSAEDIHWLLALTGPRVEQRNATMYRKLGLDASVLTRTEGLLVDVLAGGRYLIRRELAAELAERGLTLEALPLTYVLMHGELSGRVGSGPRRGRQHTYALLEERVPRGPGRSRDEALAELVRRYFTGHGPATVKDFVAWSSLTVADAKRGLAIVGDELEETTVAGRSYWSTVDSPDVSAAPDPPRAHLLQAYDEYTVAYRDSRESVADPERLSAVAPGRTDRYTHNIVLDGRIVGHWRHAAGTGAQSHLEVQLTRPLDGSETAALGDAVDRYARFLGTPMEWSNVRVP